MDAVLFSLIGQKTDAADPAGSLHAKTLSTYNFLETLQSIGIKPIFVFPSNTLRLSSDAEITSNIAAWTKVKEICVYTKGTLRVAFDFCGNITGYPCKAQIYKNGTAYGTERSKTNDSSYSTFTEDLAFDVGDKVQLYLYTNNTSSTIKVKNFRVYFDPYTGVYGNVYL